MIRTVAVKTNSVEVEMESQELAAVRRLRSLDGIMTGVLDSARPSGVDGFIVLTADRFAFEHLAGEIAHTVTVSRGWSPRLEALSNAADAIESALAHY